MRKAFLAGSILVASLLVGNAASVAADDEIPSPKPTFLMFQRHDPYNTQGASAVWDLDAPGAVPAIIAMSEPVGTPPQQEPRVLCTAADDPACSPASYQALNVSTVLGPCQSDAEVGCIEYLGSKNSAGELSALTLVDGGVTVHAENPALSLPRSATLSTWQDGAGARYVLTAYMSTTIQASSGRWVPPTTSALTVMITRIPRTTTQPAGSVSIIDSPSQPGRKTWSVANGSPGSPVELARGMRFNLKVRVPNTVSGWFQGRIANAVIGSKALSNARTVYEIEGDVLPVYVAGAEVTAADPNSPLKGTTVVGWSNRLYGPSSIQMYDSWKPFMGDKALVTRNEWVLTALALPSNTCFDASKGMTGVASTNSAFYSPTPPTYNPTTGAIDYKIASPHYDENGAVAVGSYSLSVPTAAVQCLYKTDQIPEAAELSTSYDDGSSTYTVTKSLTTKDGWINVSVSGLHFSSPTISARFGKVVGGSNGSASQNFSVLLAGAQAKSSTSGTYWKTSVSGNKATISVTLAAKGTFSIYRKSGSKLTLIKKVTGKKGTNKVVTPFKATYSFVVKDAKGKTISVRTSAVRFANFY